MRLGQTLIYWGGKIHNMAQKLLAATTKMLLSAFFKLWYCSDKNKVSSSCIIFKLTKGCCNKPYIVCCVYSFIFGLISSFFSFVRSEANINDKNNFSLLGREYCLKSGSQNELSLEKKGCCFEETSCFKSWLNDYDQIWCHQITHCNQWTRKFYLVIVSLNKISKAKIFNIYDRLFKDLCK